MKHSKTLVVLTGGTIEAMYNPEEGTPYFVPVPDSVEKSCIPAALEKLGLRDQVDIYPLCMKDSKDVKIDDLKAILTRAKGYEHVIIVHGTDTMVQNARFLKEQLANSGDSKKTIVFTGAMGPLRDKHSQWRPPETVTFQNDGWANLKKAVEEIGVTPPGVYLEMGDVPGLGPGPWEAHTVRKEVQVDGDPTNRASQVTHSGFVRDDGGRQQGEGRV